MANKNITPILVGGIGEINFGSQYRQGNRIYSSETIAMACLSQPVGNAGGNSYLYLVEEDVGMGVTACAMRGRYNEEGVVEQKLEMSDREYANTITTVQKDSLISSGNRVRKLTPKECWRLMGFSDEDYEKAERVNSKTQLYKQAGNSIVVPVLEGILLKVKPYLYT